MYLVQIVFIYKINEKLTNSFSTRSLALEKNFSGNSYSSFIIFWNIKYSFLVKDIKQWVRPKQGEVKETGISSPRGMSAGVCSSEQDTLFAVQEVNGPCDRAVGVFLGARRLYTNKSRTPKPTLPVISHHTSFLFIKKTTTTQRSQQGHFPSTKVKNAQSETAFWFKSPHSVAERFGYSGGHLYTLSRIPGF